MSDTGDATAAQDEAFESLEAQLIGRGGESKVMENELQHIITRLTDEGLVIEIFALEETPLFEPNTDQPSALLRDIARLIAESARTVENGIAIGGHIQAQPIVLAQSNTWQMSMDHATAIRQLLEQSGVAPQRIKRVTGHSDREPAVINPMAIRNNRLEIVLLRK